MFKHKEAYSPAALDDLKARRQGHEVFKNSRTFGTLQPSFFHQDQERADIAEFLLVNFNRAMVPVSMD
jgi:hypothetical protein